MTDGRGKDKPDPYNGTVTVHVKMPPAAVAEGHPETVPITIRYRTEATRQNTEADWVDQELGWARGAVRSAAWALSKAREPWNDLRSALSNAIQAWCRHHTRGHSSYWDSDADFHDHAPPALIAELRAARAAFPRGGGIDSDPVVGRIPFRPGDPQVAFGRVSALVEAVAASIVRAVESQRPEG